MPRYWFRQKNFGYGATPNTWEGWVLSIIICLCLFGVVLLVVVLMVVQEVVRTV